MRFIIEKEKKTPVTDEVEVVVAGGGPAGVAAAVASARLGAKTMLIERYGCLGGMATGGLVITLVETKRYGMGIVNEAVERLESLGGARMRQPATEPHEWKDGASFSGEECINVDPELLKYVLNEMVVEAGVDLMMHSLVVGVEMEDSIIGSIILEDKTGRHAVDGRMFVDATGDADIAAAAGAPFSFDRHPWGINVDFRFGGVDVAEERTFRDGHPEECVKVLGGLKEHVGGRMSWGPSVKDGVVWGGAPHFLEADGLSPKDLTLVEVEGRRAVVKGLEYLRAHMPGMENAFLLDTSSQVGVRETRRIIGEYVLTKEDEVGGRRFDDAIASSLFDVPYRCLVPLKVDNLLVGGRCISTTHEAQGPIRNIPPCMVTGQAAGVAAALAVKTDTPPRRLEPRDVVEALIKQGFDKLS
ncbi:MAG: FAD-dependent oxidoreductase [Candidatus Bathyarchaeota archaeon]|nr:FAD-dependent oxidoreductase [Candidatus Bathyarchaeota archaeon]